MAKRVFGKQPVGNVVHVYKFGNTTVKICDDAYRDASPEEIQRRWERIQQAAWNLAMSQIKQPED